MATETQSHREDSWGAVFPRSKQQKNLLCVSVSLWLFFFLGCASGPSADKDGFVPMFNGRDLSGWVRVNCAPETFRAEDGMIITTGKPTGVMRSERMYENYI